MKTHRSNRWLVAIAVTFACLFFAVFIFVAITYERREIPEFIELEKFPDPSLKGTVAYLDPKSGCVYAVPLRGGVGDEVHCVKWFGGEEGEKPLKPVGPQIVWLSDSRLEVTMFREDTSKYRSDSLKDLSAGWQTIIDLNTGVVKNTPDKYLPSQPNLGTRPTISPTGEALTFSSNERDGHVTITLTDAQGNARTLLDEHGPRNSNYRLNAVFWTPDFRNVIADDGRILLIAPTDPAVTRVLIPVGGGDPFGLKDERISNFAVTSEEITLGS